MQVNHFLWAIAASLALLTAGCETNDAPTNSTEQNNNGEENGEENKGDNDEGYDGKEWQEPLPEATYALSGRLIVSDFVAYADGKRNDYISFYDEQSSLTLYIDLYSSESNTMLVSGRYPLSDSCDNSTYREYSYLTLTPQSEELLRFTDGWVAVLADKDDPSGYPLHKIRAFFIMESGDSVSLDYTGTLVEK